VVLGAFRIALEILLYRHGGKARNELIDDHSAVFGVCGDVLCLLGNTDLPRKELVRAFRNVARRQVSSRMCRMQLTR